MLRIIGQFGQLGQPMHPRQNPDAFAVKKPFRRVLIAADDTSGEVRRDEIGIDEFLMKRAETGIREIIEPIESPARMVECHVPAMAVEEAVSDAIGIGRQKLP
jgi:hypothetical protein